MNVIEIRAVPYDLHKLVKGMPSLRPPRLIRRQVAGVEMRNATRTAWEGTEFIPSRQVVRRVHRYLSAERRRKQIWISLRRIFDRGIEGVTPIAIPLCVHDVTAKSNQRPILSIEIQWHRSNRKALFNLGFIVIALFSLVVVILCTYLRGSNEHRSQAEKDQGSNKRQQSTSA